jgi:hypothetical protein
MFQDRAPAPTGDISRLAEHLFRHEVRYRQELVNCVSECLCREISRALMTGNSLGLTSFTCPAKPG